MDDGSQSAAADASEPQKVHDAEPSPDDEPLHLYMDPAGDDARDGLATESAVLTMGRVQEILEERQPERDVEVWIAPGTYYAQTVEWSYTHPDYMIRFRRADDDGPRPVFDGCSASGTCAGGTWFMMRSGKGERTNMHFYYVEVKHYQTAISLNGSREEESTSNSHNRIFGCIFRNIGNVFNTSIDRSSAAVRLVNSDDNEIANNHFLNVRNPTSPGHIHSIYMAHMSQRNRVERNRFVRSDGDPVRIRDFSNDNVIRDNTFTKVGVWAGYSDWYCDSDVRDDCTKNAPECPSWGNQFRDNHLDGDYACSALATWELFQDDQTTGCSKPSADARRVRTSGNTATATPCSLL